MFGININKYTFEIFLSTDLSGVFWFFNKICFSSVRHSLLSVLDRSDDWFKFVNHVLENLWEICLSVVVFKPKKKVMEFVRQSVVATSLPIKNYKVQQPKIWCNVSIMWMMWNVLFINVYRNVFITFWKLYWVL